VLETRRPARLERNHCYETDFGWWGTFTLVGAIAETAANYAERSSMECGTVRCPPGYIAEQHKSKCGDFFTPGIRCRWYCTPDQSDLYLTDAEGNKWYDYKAREDASDRPTKKHLMFCPTCGNTGLVLWDPEDPTTIFGFSSEEQRRVPTYWQRACHEIVQVVDDDGAQRGWQERLETVQDFLSADYQVPTLNYKVSDLAAPFGVIGRNFVGDPTKWQLVSDRVPAANFSHPFEYPGDQAGQVYFDHFHEQWLAAAGRLPNDSVEVASFHAGRERLKRLFATSYGDWRWNGSAYETYTVPNNYCAGGPRSGDSCAPGSNDCVDSTSVCVKSGGYCAYYPTGEPDSAEAAVNIPCSTDATCANNPKIFCATGRCGSFGDGNDLNDTETPCRTNADCPGGGSETCDLTGFIYGRCDDASPTYPLRGVACTSDAMCNTKSDGTGVGTCVGEDPDGQAPANGTYGFCSAGVNVLKACGAAGGATCWDAAAHQASCVGQCSAESAKNPGACMTDTECRVSGSCQATTVWLPPADRCRDNIRPSRFTEEPLTDPDGGGDWCGVSPEVFNVKIENAESPIFFGVGQTNITLSFNVKVDNDQLPLRLLRVRWDMENRDKAVTDNDWRSGLRDKSDPTDPFQFTHTYKYEQNTCDKGALAGGAPDGYCDFQVGITVRDNWCWCSNANFAGVNTTNLACNNCPDDLTPAVADDVNGAWVEARSARVRICDSARPELCGR
ncbi:MAG: hypothetical protein Q7S23_02085, partial [bacterium]|nr:hypothetical protein [bacterium]